MAGKAVAKVGVVTTGGSEAEKAIADLAEGLVDAKKQVEKFEKGVDAGRGGVARFAALAEVELEKVRAAMAALPEPTGQEAEELAKLEARIAAASDKANDFQDKLQTAKERIGDTNELLGKIDPRLADFALKWGLAAASISEVQGVLRDVVGGLNDTAKALGGTGDEFKGLDDKLGPAFGKLKADLPKIAQFLRDVADAEGSLHERFVQTAEDWTRRAAGLATEREQLEAYEAAKSKWADAVEKANEKAARSEEARAKAAEDAAAREAAELERVRQELDKQYAARQHYQEQVETINASTLDAAEKSKLLAAAEKQLADSLAGLDEGGKKAATGLNTAAGAAGHTAENFSAAKAEAEGLARTLDYVFTYGDRAKAADDKAAEAKERNADATKELEAAEAELAKLRALTTLDPAQQARLDELEAGQFQRQETARRLAQEQLRWEQEAAQLRKRQTDEENQNHAAGAKSRGAVVDQLTAQAEAAGKLEAALAAMNAEWVRSVDLAGQFMAILGGGAKAAGAGGATP